MANYKGRCLASIEIGYVDDELGTRLRSAYTKVQNETDYVKKAKCFYEIQTFRTLGIADEQHNISVYVDKSVGETYKGHIAEALEDINIAAPGINLFEIKENTANISIFGGMNGCNTLGTYRTHAKINLDTRWDVDWKGQTTIHELLHALGFQHEFKRKDAKTYVKINTEDRQYQDQTDHYKIRGLTRFDPFSVMMYPENNAMFRQDDGDEVWKLKPGTLPNKKMSELDKVALNMVFTPCRGNDYEPKIGDITQMLYCGRKVMTGNQQIGPTDTDGRCGPDNWANCPACRVLVGSKIYQDKWQGWSGLFYCGKIFTKPKDFYRAGVHMKHDGVCGPNNGPPCTDCGLKLYPTYDYTKEFA